MSDFPINDQRLYAGNLSWYNYVTRQWDTINYPNALTKEDAAQYISQSSSAQAMFDAKIQNGKTPYRAMLEILASGM